ncbi:MAG TPA: fumarylacetoacetate hydrolase family protein [Streptosporangiaceae bacterium]|jgi:2-keto-4-pentenoate hydratase/2-oxohepta-3-ene-1,7-dioic acid hydratase in catechol pathway|nr:fumarylacetoacetate hydrolase family protein [Streptosporangiaceae bacterium]
MAAVDPYALGQFRAHTDFGPRADDFTGVVAGAEVAPLAALLPSAPDLDALLADWPAQSKLLSDVVDEARAGQRWADLARPVSDFARRAPLRPGQIFQSGANYKTHVVQLMMASAAEMGDDDPEATRRNATALMEERAARGTPYVFIGLASAICGPDDNVVLPDIGVQHDWELELGVVIGTEAYRVGPDDALAHVAGYVIANDLTTRDRVFRPDMPGLGTDWLAGKNSPTFLPLGPWLVPAAFVPDPANLRITLTLNGETMQDETTAGMIFGVPDLIAHISAITPLRPGDLVLTGSPAGNGAHYGRYLRPGDIMEATISGLGTQRNRCVQP